MSAALLLQAAELLAHPDTHDMVVPCLDEGPASPSYSLSQDDELSCASSDDVHHRNNLRDRRHRHVPSRSIATAPYRRSSRDPTLHSTVEKQRRSMMTQSYAQLKSLIPSVANSRASSVNILKHAAIHIKDLVEEEERLLEEKAKLVAEQQRLLALGAPKSVLRIMKGEQVPVPRTPSPDQCVPSRTAASMVAMTSPWSSVGAASFDDIHTLVPQSAALKKLPQQQQQQQQQQLQPSGLLMLAELLVTAQPQAVTA